MDNGVGCGLRIRAVVHKRLAGECSLVDMKSREVVNRIAQRIILVRGMRVIVDSDLAELYGTTKRTLNEQVRRNGDRFPDDFATISAA